jgi:integrase/recombinase XerC
MNLSGHEDRRTLQRYLKPSKEGKRRRLDGLDAQRGAWTAVGTTTTWSSSS